MAENPIKTVLHDIAPTVMEAARKLGLGFEPVRRVSRGLPRRIPDHFKLALVEKFGWNGERLAALERDYTAWREHRGEPE